MLCFVCVELCFCCVSFCDVDLRCVSLCIVCWPCQRCQLTFKTPTLCKLNGERGGGSRRGRVPGRTGRRSRCCGFAKVLGLSRGD